MPLSMQVVMRAIVEPDTYAGDTCDQIRPLFRIYCEGDDDSDLSAKDITIELAQLPAGATVEVSYPKCPDCSLERQDTYQIIDGAAQHVGHEAKCECGFDWEEWTRNEYS